MTNSIEKYNGRQDWNWLRQHAPELAKTHPLHTVAIHHGELVYMAPPEEPPSIMRDLLLEQGRSRSEVLIFCLGWLQWPRYERVDV